MKVYTNYFYGNKISDYGIKNGYVDYRTLAKAFDAVMNNNIMQNTADIGYWEQESGFINNEDEIEELKEKIEELEEYKDVAKEEKIAEIEEKIAELEEQIEELEYEQENYYPEIFQYYIVSDNGAEILKEINEIVFYNDVLDMYIWGVDHWGTSWDYVLTNIKIEEYKN